MDRLNAFLSEIEAVRKALIRIKSKTITRGSVIERIVELYTVWVAQVSAIVVDKGVLTRTSKKLNDLFELLLSLTAKTNSVSKYRKYIKDILFIYQHDVILYLENYSNILARDEKIDLIGSNYSITDDLSKMINIPRWYIPKSLVGYTKEFRTFLDKYKFDYNVFIIIKYRDANKDLLKSVCSIVEDNGFNPIVAKYKKITDDLYNPIACLLCCKYGIAIYDDPEPEQEFNPNVAYEIALMHFLQRTLLLLKSNKLKIPPSDIMHKLYEPYKNTKEATAIVNEWIKALIKEPT